MGGSKCSSTYRCTKGVEAARESDPTGVSPESLAATEELQRLMNERGALEAPVAAQQADLAKIEATLAAMESANTIAEKGVLDENKKKQAELTGVQAYVGFESAQDNLNKAQQGIQAPITGVVTALTATEGAAATQYTPLCVIESLDKVNVEVSLSRYDLERVKEGQRCVVKTLGKEYEAYISKIDGMATAVVGNSGTTTSVTATISLKNPTPDICLGLEANVEIFAAKVDNAIKVPISAINTDVDGSYCFVVVDGAAQRREVVMGISNDTEVEVISGLEVGDAVILSSQNVYEGALVTEDPAMAPPEQTMMMFG